MSYGINATAANKNVPMYVNIAIFALTLPCLFYLIKLVPERPADHDDVVDGQVAEAKVL